MLTTFEAIKAILEPYAARLRVSQDGQQGYCLDAGFSEKWKKNIMFAAVRLGKSYVSYHLMPVYMFPDLLDGLSPELKKRMQGKSCFNFRSIDATQIKELSRLTKAGFGRFKKERLVE